MPTLTLIWGARERQCGKAVHHLGCGRGADALKSAFEQKGVILADGLIVRVSTDVSRGGVSGVALYAVACASADEAVRTVRTILPENWRAKGAIGPISAETIAQLGIADGEARLL